MSAEPMLRVENLSAGYESGVPIVRGASIEVAPGEVVAILGPNGAGKSTLIRSVAGLVPKFSGRVLLAGMDITALPAYLVIRHGLAFVPQTENVFAGMTVADNFALAAAVLPAHDRHARIGEMYTFFPRLEERRSTLAGRLSGGERQRLAMAVAFLPPVDVYLFDEPSASLDPVASRLFFQRARQLKRDGRTLLFTTHIPADVRHLATRIVLLRDGRLESEAAGEFELRERMLERDMWGNDHEDPIHGHRAGDRMAADDGLRDTGAVAGAGAARSR